MLSRISVIMRPYDLDQLRTVRAHLAKLAGDSVQINTSDCIRYALATAAAVVAEVTQPERQENDR